MNVCERGQICVYKWKSFIQNIHDIDFESLTERKILYKMLAKDTKIDLLGIILA